MESMRAQMGWPGRAARALLALGCVAGLAACGEPAVEAGVVARPVKIMTFHSGGAMQVLEYPGTVAATQRADVSFEVPGRVIEFPVNEGQDVRQGDVIAKLDPRDYQSDLDKQIAISESSRAEFERQKVLFEKDVASKQVYEKALRNFEMSEANVDIARKALEDTVILAPFDGRVARKLVDEFQQVKAKEPIATVQAEDVLEVRVAIPERDAVRARRGIDQVQRGAEADRNLSVVVSSLPDRVFPAWLKEFSTEADPVTRTFSATVYFEVPTDVSVLPGMTANVRVEVRNPERMNMGPTIPSLAALADESGNAYVWAIDPEAMTAHRKSVQLGELTGSSVAVLGGLEDGDQIAISGVHQLREGMPVRRYEN